LRGHFITFEGGEGSGKSTHAATLAHRLKSLGLEVVLTREPGGSTGAEIIRHILLSGIAKPLGAETEAILFAAARDDHVRNTILPALDSGRWVICDRFIDSTRVYQGALGHVDQRLIRSLERVTVGQAFPELTFILDVPAEIGLARAGAGRTPLIASSRSRRNFMRRFGRLIERSRSRSRSGALSSMAVRRVTRCRDASGRSCRGACILSGSALRRPPRRDQRRR
jgi:dTMP kinase